jgi:ABC-type sugar transport system permease subunit
MGYAAAISALLFFGILLVTLMQFKLIRQRNT